MPVAQLEDAMDTLHLNCAGLDVHKDTVVACSRRVSGTKAVREVRTFKTMTSDLLALSEWLASLGCTAIVMEATGVYWKLSVEHPERRRLGADAGECRPREERSRPQDRCERCDLAGRSAGTPSRSDASHRRLVRASFVPDTQTQEQRVLLRTRKQLTRERSSHVQRLQKTLEQANIKLDSVITDITGTSGRAMIEALIAGVTDPVKLAALANRRIRAAPADLTAALRGRVTKHHRFMLRLHLEQIDAINRPLLRSTRRSRRTSTRFAR